MNTPQEALAPPRGVHPIVGLLSLVFFALAFALFGGALAIGLLQLVGIPHSAGQPPFTSPHARTALFVLQAFSLGGGAIAGSLLYLKWVERASFGALQSNRAFPFPIVLAVFFTVVAIGPVNNLIIEWNNAISFPPWLKAVEEWMQQEESTRNELTKILVTIPSLPDLLFSLVVMAIIPAIGEELLFRGIVQNKLLIMSKNTHVAIWLTAIIFSAIHVQFYGFVPRMLLGALFGYIYAWSGNLWLAMWGHFVNNAFVVVMSYLYQQKLSSIDIDSTEAITWPVAALSAVVTVGTMLYIKRYYAGRVWSESNG